MAEFKQLIQIEGTGDDEERAVHNRQRSERTAKASSKGTRSARSKYPAGRGCENCTLDKVKGVVKIFGNVTGKSIFVWGQSPGFQENKAGKELLGPAGQWWWKEAKAAGIDREDCDIQNVVRCFPADYTPDEWPTLRMRNPSKLEVKCCSIFNEQAIAKSQAKVHIILGQVAAKQLLGQEYKKDMRVFWSKKLKAKVVCLDHPAFFLRRGGKSIPQSDTRLLQFRRDLKYAASVAKIGGGKYGYIKSQNHIGVTSIRLARQAYRELREDAVVRGKRVSGDLEEGRVDSRGRATKDNSGRRAPLCYGFCSRIGKTWVFPLEHPDVPVSDKVRRYCRKIVRKLLSDPAIRFIFQHGSYDVTATHELLKCTVRNYDYDTNYAEFFAYPERYSFALDAIAEARFPEFVGYKEIVTPEAFTQQALDYFKEHRLEKADLHKRYTLARKSIKGGLNLALVPWKKMVLYNGADNDIQKRIEVTTKKKVSLPLLHVYQDAQFVLNLMEKNPPLFDYQHYDKLENYYPVLERYLYKQLVKLSGKKDLNPNSSKQAHEIIYNKLKLPALDEKPNTRKETMAALAQFHKFPAILAEQRRVKKICTTYLAGFKASADQNAGHVRTIWWLTGTRTGRMSSGGGDSGESGVVNLQNIHGDPQLQCLLVSDLRWREVYTYWKEHGPFTEKTWRKFEDIDVFLGFDHAQMELRVVAQKSGDPNLIKGFCSDEDIHAIVGSEITPWTFKQCVEDETIRRVVKNFHFGIVYGLNENGVYPYLVAKGAYKPLPTNPTDADLARVRKEETMVKRYYHKYFAKYVYVRRMIESDRAFVEKNGFCQTLFGFVRKLDIHQEGGAFWGNQAVNTPIQGTAHQLMLIGIIPIRRKPKTYALLQRPQLEIHDAIYFLSKLKFLFQSAAKGKYMLEKESLKIVEDDFGIKWKVPLKAEPKAALRFGVQIKNLGISKADGPMNEWEFLNQWCEKNQKIQQKFLEQRKAFATQVSTRSSV